IDRFIAFATAGADDHVHVREQIGVTFGTGTFERQSGRIGADPLPRLHLALIAFFRNLFVKLNWREWVHNIGRESPHLRLWRRFVETLPVDRRSLAQAGDDADAGDPRLARRISHWRPFPSEMRSRLRPPACRRGIWRSGNRPAGT